MDVAKTVIQSLAVLVLPTRKDLMRIIRKQIKGTGYRFPLSTELWEAYRLLQLEGFKKHEVLERVLRVKDVRTDSGVAPITVLTKPYPCPGNCVYCPLEERMPKSYISSEPAAARALSLEFDPYEQVYQRVRALERNGHTANKIELIVKGATWSAYPQDYREWFIQRCFEAANELTPHPLYPAVKAAQEPRTPYLPLSGETVDDPFPQYLCVPYRDDLTALARELRKDSTSAEQKIKRFGTVLAAQKQNETAAYRIIGLTVETRPDWVTADEVIHLRKLGVTRVELGLQIINDRVLEMNKRGTTVDDAARAIALLKSAGFKVDVHIMPGLPGATIKDDLESFRLLFADPRFRPDMIKIYPCVVLPNSELAEWFDRGDFKPLKGEDLKELLIRMQTMIPRYCRVSRMIRDFPSQDIAEGNKDSNLREMLETEMKRRGLHCHCLRCREVGHVPGDHTKDQTELFEERYENADGTEVFLSIENRNRTAVFGFCRLRMPHASSTAGAEKILEAFPVLKSSAFIRELHTYGTALNINQQDAQAAQHKGYGRQLMQEAERIAKREGYAHMAVISGIGVREYYTMLGYDQKDTYMIKSMPPVKDS